MVYSLQAAQLQCVKVARASSSQSAKEEGSDTTRSTFGDKVPLRIEAALVPESSQESEEELIAHSEESEQKLPGKSEMDLLRKFRLRK